MRNSLSFRTSLPHTYSDASCLCAGCLNCGNPTLEAKIGDDFARRGLSPMDSEQLRALRLDNWPLADSFAMIDDWESRCGLSKSLANSARDYLLARAHHMVAACEALGMEQLREVYALWIGHPADGEPSAVIVAQSLRDYIDTVASGE